MSDSNPSPAFNHFIPLLHSVNAIQIVKNCNREKTFENGLEIRSLIPWLTRCDLSSPRN